jgi:isoprenylcysteine carboxyl methyltransferase (ICMT) family protein YpbQ
MIDKVRSIAIFVMLRSKKSIKSSSNEREIIAHGCVFYGNKRGKWRF